MVDINAPFPTKFSPLVRCSESRKKILNRARKSDIRYARPSHKSAVNRTGAWLCSNIVDSATPENGAMSERNERSLLPAARSQLSWKKNIYVLLSCPRIEWRINGKKKPPPREYSQLPLAET